MTVLLRAVLFATTGAVVAAACNGKSDTVKEESAIIGAPCPLGGRWSIQLWRDTLRTTPPIDGRRSTGWIQIADSAGSRQIGQSTATWQGHYALAIDGLFGPNEGGVMSTSVKAGTRAQVQSGLEARLVDGRLSVDLSPLVSHGPVSLEGQFRGDSIEGRWEQRSEDFLRAPRGRFLMIRGSPCLGTPTGRPNER